MGFIKRNYKDFGIAITFLIAYLNLPYGFYEILKLVWTVYFLYKMTDEKNEKLKFFYVFSLFLFNPFFKIRLDKEFWMFLDTVYFISIICITMIKGKMDK